MIRLGLWGCMLFADLQCENVKSSLTNAIMMVALSATSTATISLLTLLLDEGQQIISLDDIHSCDKGDDN